MLEQFMTQLSQELSMEDLITTTEDHHFILPFDHDIEVDASEVEKGILLKSIIGSCPQKNAEAFLLKTMEANLFGMGTRGAVIGLNEEEKLLTLSMEVDYNSSFKDFKEKLEDFTSVLDFWRTQAMKHQ